MNKRMNTVVKWLAVAVLAGLSPAVFSQAALKIAVVDYNRLIDESPQAKAAMQTLQNEFAPKQKELVAQQTQLKERGDKFNRDSATMAEAERSKTEKSLRDSVRDLQAKQQAAQEDYNARRGDELNRLQQLVAQEVQAYAKAQGYDLVLAGGAVVYAKDSFNITSAVLSALQTKGGAAAQAAPAAPAAKKP